MYSFSKCVHVYYYVESPKQLYDIGICLYKKPKSQETKPLVQGVDLESGGNQIQAL